MYPIILATHNVVRWVVFILGIVALTRSLRGWVGKREWSAADHRIGVFFTSTLDTQLLLGLILYLILSPITTSAFQNFSAAMSNDGQRFFVLEHVMYMLLAVVFAHLGGSLPKRVDEAASKYRRASTWFGLAVVVILLGMPWMRPLLPGL